MAYIIARPEFGDHESHVLVIHKALCGMKPSGKRFWEKLHDSLVTIGFKPSKHENFIWMRPAKNLVCYEYIAVYVDNLAIAGINCGEICSILKDNHGFKLKGKGPLTYHLGCDYVCDPDGTLVGTP